MAEKQYTGVQWDTKIQQWKSMLRHGGKTYNCGLYNDQMSAVKARDICIINNGLKVALQVIKPIKKKK